MEENKIQQESKIKESKDIAKKDFKGFSSSITKFVKELFSIKYDADRKGTIDSIKDSIAMKGHTAWILVFSIIIASIGLNVSSTAVVIGAMLISPLMGPILGIGLSIGINDVETLKRSMINLGVMLGISLLTSFLFFSIPLFDELTPELFARTKPDVRDVLIAIAGGLALIIAISRPSPQTNTVAGVAIATALMPPLCTAGYGLAIGNWSFVGGALFLFLINTTFIALSTYTIVKYLNFPMKRYLDSKKKRRISRIASFVGFVVICMSLYTFYNLYLEKVFYNKAEHFVETIKADGFIIIDKGEEDISYIDKLIDLTIFGKAPSLEDEQKWKKRLLDIGLNEKVNLIIHKGKDDTQLINEFQSLKNQISENRKSSEDREKYIRNKEDKIRSLEAQLKLQTSRSIPFLKLSEEAKINYEGLEEIAFSQRVKTNFSSVDTITVFDVKWNDTIPETTLISNQAKMKNWLKSRLEIDTLIIKNR